MVFRPCHRKDTGQVQVCVLKHPSGSAPSGAYSRLFGGGDPPRRPGSLQVHITPAGTAPLMELHQDRPQPPFGRGPGRKDADDPFPSTHLPVEPLEVVRGAEPGADVWGEAMIVRASSTPASQSGPALGADACKAVRNCGLS